MVNHGSFFQFFIRVLVSGFWLGRINRPYSFELGFGGSGRVVEPSIWCYSWEQYVTISMLFGYQRKGGFPLHVVWRFMDTVWKRVEWFVWMLVTRSYRDTRDWLSFFVAWGDRRKNWLGIGPFRFMEVTISDGPITKDLGRNMCRGVDTATDYSNAL